MDKIVDVLPIGSASGFDWTIFWLVKAQNLFGFLTSPTGVVWTVIIVGVAIIGLLIIRR